MRVRVLARVLRCGPVGNERKQNKVPRFARAGKEDDADGAARITLAMDQPPAASQPTCRLSVCEGHTPGARSPQPDAMATQPRAISHGSTGSAPQPNRGPVIHASPEP